MVQNLRITRVAYGDAVVVTVVGEIDIGTVCLLEKGLTAALRHALPPRALVVDLREVRFFGAAGVTALVKAEIGCRQQDTALQVVANHRAVLRPLEIVKLIETLRVVPDLPPQWASWHRTTQASHAILDAARRILMTDRLTNTRKSSATLVE